jgi:hypothetical protein
MSEDSGVVEETLRATTTVRREKASDAATAHQREDEDDGEDENDDTQSDIHDLLLFLKWFSGDCPAEASPKHRDLELTTKLVRCLSSSAHG